MSIFYKIFTIIKTGTKLWACAYEFDNNKTTMGLILKSIYGMVRGYGWDYEEATEEEYMLIHTKSVLNPYMYTMTINKKLLSRKLSYLST